MPKDDKLDYIPLRAWCTFMGSLPYWRKDELALARKDGAPQDVIYHRPEDQVRRLGEDPHDAERYFAGKEGRFWARYRPDEVPEFTRAQMDRYIRNYETTGGPHG